MRSVALVLSLALATFGIPAAATAQQPDANLMAKGAALYGKNCARCHNLRSPTEYTDVAWRTIMAQMRARANLTREEARAILAFVQATNGVGGAPAAAAATGATPERTPAAKGTKAKAPVATVPADQLGADVGDGHLTPAARKALRAYIDSLRSKERR